MLLSIFIHYTHTHTQTHAVHKDKKREFFYLNIENLVIACVCTSSDKPKMKNVMFTAMCMHIKEAFTT